MIDAKKFFNQPVKNDKITHENIKKIATGQGYDYTFDCLLDYSYFKEKYMMIAKDLSKQQALNADPRTIHQINFTANLDCDGDARIFCINSKRNYFGFFTRNCKSIANVLRNNSVCFNIISL